MELKEPGEEVKHLRRSMSDLISVLALPAIWSGKDARQMVTTFHDALLAMLHLDFLSTQATTESGGDPVEVATAPPRNATAHGVDQVRQAIRAQFGDEANKWPAEMRLQLDGDSISLVSNRLGIEGEIGMVVAGSARDDFPTQSERLLLGVAANQLAVGLQQARLLNDQKRIADDLDRRVAERTSTLAKTNEDLQLQVGLLQHLPVSTWTLKPDGTPDFVNEVWLEFSGQTLEFVRSNPEAWLTAVHPDDREGALKKLWDGVRAGHGFAFEARALRARDKTYRWHLQQAVVLRDAEGKVIKFVGTTTDIDDQKRAEEAFRASESNLRRVIDTIPTLSWCNLPDGPNEFLSRSWHEYTGLSPEQAHGWGWAEAFHSEDLPPLLKRWQQLLVSGESGEIEARIRRHDGVYRWFLIRVAPFRDQTGAIVRWYGTSTDIHDRKLSDEALRASENNFRQIVHSIPGLVCTMDAAGEIEQLNRPLMEYFGKTAEELKSWKMTDAVHPDDLAEVIKAYTHAVTTGNPYEIEHRCQRADGVYRWFQVRALAVRDAEDRITGWYVLLTDIDDRKRAEDAALASERSLGLIINTMPVLAWSARPDGSAEFLSRRWLEYTGFSADQARDWGWTAAIHPDDRARLTDYWNAVIATGSPVEIEGRIRRADGEYRWFLFRADPLRDEAGNIVKWYGTNTDIDDRKRAEDQLRRSEAFLAEAQHLTRIGSFSWRVAANQITWSEQLYRIYDLVPGSPLTFDVIGSRMHPDDFEVMNQVTDHAHKATSDFEFEYRLLAPDGSIRYLRSIAHAIRDHEGLLEYVGAVQDVTQRHLAEEALARARSELANVTRATSLGVLAASMAHEVSQPLAGILMNASTCVRMLDSNSPNIEGALETARRTIRDGNRASDVITRLRKLFGKKEVSVEPFDLNEAAREVVMLLLTDLQRNRVVVRQELADGLPHIQGDRIQLQQVIMNFLRNASDSLGSVEDRPRQLVIRTDDDNDSVRLTVRDTGVGFDSTASTKLFEAFYTTKSDGMGIGLSVSRSIIDAHHGKIWAHANDGPGSTFAFSIPKASAASLLGIGNPQPEYHS